MRLVRLRWVGASWLAVAALGLFGAGPGPADSQYGRTQIATLVRASQVAIVADSASCISPEAPRSRQGLGRPANLRADVLTALAAADAPLQTVAGFGSRAARDGGVALNRRVRLPAGHVSPFRPCAGVGPGRSGGREHHEYRHPPGRCTGRRAGRRSTDALRRRHDGRGGARRSCGARSSWLAVDTYLLAPVSDAAHASNY